MRITLLITIGLFICCNTLYSQSQRYLDLIQQGKTELKKKNFKASLTNFLSAEIAANEDNYQLDSVNGYINGVFDQIKNQKEDAEKSRNKLAEQLEINKQKQKTIDSLNELQLEKYDYAVKNHLDVLRKLEDDLIVDSLISEFYSCRKDDSEINNLRNSVLLSSEAFKNKSYKAVQAEYFRYPNKYTLRKLDSIKNIIIGPKTKYDNLEKYFDNPNYNAFFIALKDTSYIVVVAEDYPYNYPYYHTKLFLFKRGEDKPLHYYTLTNSLMSYLNFSCNSNYFAFAGVTNDIYIFDSTLTLVKTFPFNNNDESSKTPIITNLSFLTIPERSNGQVSIYILVSWDYSNSNLIKIKNFKSKPEIVTAFEGESVFINDELSIYSKAPDLEDPRENVFSMNGKGRYLKDIELTKKLANSKFNSFGVSDSLVEKTEDVPQKNSNFLDSLFDDAKKLKEKNTYKETDKTFEASMDKRMVFQKVSNEKLGYEDSLNTIVRANKYEIPYYNSHFNNSYFLQNDKFDTRVLATNKRIKSKQFSSDNHLFTLTQDDNLLEWSFDYIDENDHKYEAANLLMPFTIIDSVIYKLIDLEQIPETKESINSLMTLRKYYTHYDEDNGEIVPEHINLLNAKKRRIINNKLFNITQSDNDRVELAQSYGDVAWHSILTSKFDDAIESANAGIELAPSETWIYTNLALGYLLSNQNSEALKIYNDYKVDLFRPFIGDLDRVEKMGIISPDDKRIKIIFNILNYKPKNSLYFVRRYNSQGREIGRDSTFRIEPEGGYLPVMLKTVGSIGINEVTLKLEKITEDGTKLIDSTTYIIYPKKSYFYFDDNLIDSPGDYIVTAVKSNGYVIARGKVNIYVLK